MRALILVAGASLAISACNNEQAAENSVEESETLTANDIGANDVTSIDAVTGADANMAEDVQLTLNDLDAANATDENGSEAANSASSNRAD